MRRSRRRCSDLVQREKRLSYRVLKWRPGVDDDELEDLQEDLIYAKQLVVDEEGRVLVWTGDAMAAPPAVPPGRASDQVTLDYLTVGQVTHLAARLEQLAWAYHLNSDND